MSYRHQTLTITGSSPAAPGTAAVGDQIGGLGGYDRFIVVAALAGSTNGAVDCALQFKNPDADEWWDWIRFPQVAAAAATKYQVQCGGDDSGIVVVGSCTEASPAITLAANNSLGGRPTDRVRLVVTAGSGTDSAATQTVRLICWRRPK